MGSPNPDREGELGLPNASIQWSGLPDLQHGHPSHLLGDHY